MTHEHKTFNELRKVMTDALLKMQSLTENGITGKTDFVSMAKVFLLGMISTAADLAEFSTTGASAYLYAEIEAGAKQGGIRYIKEFQAKNGASYSLSGIEEDDPVMAMNYLGQELSSALFKNIHELPKPLRTPEMLLRAVEALLANLLNQKFDNSHDVLDSLCEHVHMALDDLQSRTKLKGMTVN
jgi:hypothetical protein